MESIPKNPILQFNEDTLTSIRTETRLEKEEDVNTAVNLLGDWIKKQNHFLKKIFPREYLERSILFLKGSVERAKSHTEKLCTFRTLYPNFFNKYDARKDCFAVLKYGYISVILPKPTNDNYRIFFIKMTPEFISAKIFFSAFVLIIMYFEYLKLHDYSNGFIVVVDMRDINIMDLMKEVNFTEIRQIIDITTEGYGFRAKSIHFITSSSAIETLVKIIKPMLSTKMGSRITAQKTVEDLHKIINKEILPVEYGGSERSLNTLVDEWITILSTEEHVNHLKEMNQARTDESLRPVDSNQENDEVAGSFRKLSVD